VSLGFIGVVGSIGFGVYPVVLRAGSCDAPLSPSSITLVTVPHRGYSLLIPPSAASSASSVQILRTESALAGADQEPGSRPNFSTSDSASACSDGSADGANATSAASPPPSACLCWGPALDGGIEAKAQLFESYRSQYPSK